MAMTGDAAWGKARKLVEETLKGEGALKGKDGKDGTSAYITAARKEVEKMVVITTTDSNGETIAYLYDGKKGEQGEKGDKGDKGDTGSAFAIGKIYNNLESMLTDIEPVDNNILVVVIGTDVANLYLRSEEWLDPDISEGHTPTDGYIPFGSTKSIISAIPSIDKNTHTWKVNNADTGVVAEPIQRIELTIQQYKDTPDDDSEPSEIQPFPGKLNQFYEFYLIDYPQYDSADFMRYTEAYAYIDNKIKNALPKINEAGNWEVNGEDTGATGKAERIDVTKNTPDKFELDVLNPDGTVKESSGNLRGVIYIDVTKEEYENLSDEEKNKENVYYHITDFDRNLIMVEELKKILYIGKNNNWFIGDKDTGILATGKSIATLEVDADDNVIITYTDGNIQNIGTLSISIDGDFLSVDGFGNIRYYDNKFQYFNVTLGEWVDIQSTTENAIFVQLKPAMLKKFSAIHNPDSIGDVSITLEGQDLVVNNQCIVYFDYVVIVRKLGSYPESESDGTTILTVKRRDMRKYAIAPYIDYIDGAEVGEKYYYKAYVHGTSGLVNDLDELSVEIKDYALYGFKLDQNESDPASMITYLSDCDNKYYKSAKMNYTTDTFDYGDWDDAWFIKNLKPCMLKYDGTVDYELDKNDYTKKLDGTDSDVANASYGGNAMVGIPKVYWKIVNNGDNTANIYFSDKQVDTDFHCWSHIDNNGNEIDYCYMPIYNGSNVNSVLRSISGKAPTASQTAASEITYAKANNTGSDIIWYTELFNDRMLINLLLLLIGKSTNTQVIFGTGNNNSYVSNSNTGIKNTGAMNTKGLFWGNQDNKSGVKVFGMENWYGNIWRRIGGWINDKGTQKIKMTYGQSDGSTVDGYNLDGNGYITIGNSTPSGTSGGYISKMMITDNGLIPTIASGSATTYYCDGLWFNNSQVDYACVGGDSGDASIVGALSSALHAASSSAGWVFGAALSCKPLASAT